MGSSYRMELDTFLKDLTVNSKMVLDIGGSQLPLPKRVANFNVEEYLIADLPEPHADSPKPDFAIDLNIPFVLQKDNKKLKADAIFCLEVFDYVWDPATAFMNLKTHLKNDGIIIVTFPFMYPTHQPIEDDALRYTEGGIRKLANSVDLEINKIIPRRPETNAIEFLWRSERMRAAKHYDHNVTGWIVIMRHKNAEKESQK